ncbi:trigger factor [Mycoplasma phocoenae]|uniref:Trigger factor n=1 Tax=Mycoplasma phocoenae TaxID=754517 RepID=A0A858U5U9_9MOLU|nr:trigger factor [Mycoplasma phocoenae]QJG66817.1 trigger factor [Mycoplasma phocoenae]
MLKRTLNKETSELTITVNVDKQAWLDAQAKAKKDLIANLQIPGFRKGKVPADKAAKHISAAQVMGKAITPMLDESIKKAVELLTDEDIILDSPTYQLPVCSTEELVIEFIYPMVPEVDIIDYKKLGVKIPAVKVEKEDVEKSLEALLQAHALLMDTDELIQDKDHVNFDFKGFLEGQPFDGGEAEGFDLVIGSNSFIPGFEESMKSFKKGDQGEFNITFPETYHMEFLKGKETTFKIKVNNVKRPQLPKLDDEFAKEAGIENVSNVKELKDYMKDLATREKNEAAKNTFAQEAIQKIVEGSKYPLPESIIAKETNQNFKRFEEQIKNEGMSFEQFLDATKQNKKTIYDNIRNQAIQNLKISFTYTELAKREQIKVEDKDYEKEYERLSKLYGMSAEEVAKYITKEQIQIPLINSKIIASLAKYNDPKGYELHYASLLEDKKETKK